MHYTLLGYATSFIILFTNFYIHTYIKGKRNQKLRETRPPDAKTNGVVPQNSLEEKKNL